MRQLYKNLTKSLVVLALICNLNLSFKAQTGAALNFDASNDYVQMSSINFGTSWTAEAWIRPTNLTGNWNTVLGQCYYNNLQGFVIAVQNGSVFLDSPTGGVISTSVSNAVWTHIAATYNNGIYAFYKNGLIVGTIAAPFSNSSNPFYLGIRTTNNNSGLIDPYQGDIDEVRIWNYARSACEIQQYMNCEITTTATALEANYHFNQGIANSILNYLSAPFTLTDATGNGHSGAVTNFALNFSGNSNWVSPGGVTSGNTTPASAPTAEIDVKGNATSITDGDITPSISDFTNFNGAATRTFVIYNTGSQTLNVASPVITGPDASSYTVYPVSSNVLSATTGTASFVVAFTPSSLGAKTATINIYNQDCNEQFYKFGITATCVAGAALSFDGVDDYVETGANLAQLGQADFTMEAWIKTTGASEGIITYCDNDAGWEAGEMSLYLDASGIPTFVGFNNSYIPGNIAVNNGAWHHVAVVWDYSGSGTSGIGHMYIDGVDHTGSVSYVANTNNGTGSFKIGKQNYNNFTPEAPNNFLGEIDEVRVYDRALCLPEILHNMNCEILSPGSYPDLNGYYKFNQGLAFGTNTAVTTATDAAVFNNTGTLTNFSLTAGSSSNWSASGAVTSGSSCTAYLDEEINLRGNSVNIVSGDLSPSLADHTSFGFVGLGSVLTRTFAIQNTGTAALTISTYVITGANASSFTITTNPAASVVAGGSTSIVISFSAAALGAKNALITITNSDCDESVYTFSISATGAAAAAALNFDGVNDAINTKDPVIGLSDFTIEGWIKPSAAGGFLVSSRFNEGFQTGYWYTIGTNSAGIIGMEMAECGNGSSNYNTFNATNSITPGNWGHFAIVRSGSIYKLFINGNLSTTFTETALHNFDNSAVNTSNILNIGGWIQNSCCWYTGSMDELRIWTVARTQCEIQSFMNCEIPTTASNLVSNYHFNQGADALANPSINRLVDASASAYTGTLNAGFALTGSTSNWIAPGGVTSGNTASVSSVIEIDVTGNGTSIPDGNASTSTTNFTDFNAAMTRTFVVQNTVSTGTLIIGTLSITGTDANQFSITTLPSSSISGIGSTSFVVSFIPTSTGVKNATLNIASNDCNESLYDFVITATAIPAAAINFDGVNDQIAVSSGIILNSQSFSIEFWAKRAVNGTNAIAVGQGTTVSTNQSLQLGFRNSDQFTFAFYLNDINYLGPQTTDGNFHHWACVYDATAIGKNRFLYCDGLLVQSDFSNSAFLGTGTLVIGNAGYGSNPYNGTLDELRIWSVARTQCEIQTHMNSEIAGSQSGLLANYHFNQAVSEGLNTAATTLTDDNTTPKNGSLSNFSLTGANSNWIAPGAIAIGYTTVSVPTSTLLISGNSNPVLNGSTATSTLNFTDFGIVSTRTFVLQNTGTGPLYINIGYLTGANATNFTVTTTPSSVIAGGSSSSVVIDFTPTALASHSAILNIVTSDCTHPTYSFVISATPLPAEALNLDGTDDYIAVTGHTLNNSFTIEFHARRNSNITHDYIYGQGTASDNNGLHIGFYDIGVGNFFNFGFWNNDLDVVHADFLWHHWACVYDISATGHNRFVYRDGVLIGSDRTAAAYLGTGLATIGSNPWNTGLDAFEGDLDDLRIWSTARTQCEIQSYMNCEIASTATGLISNYKFNQGLPSGPNSSETTLLDAAGTFTGALTNFSLSGSTSNWVSPGAVVSGSTSPAVPTATVHLSGNSNSITPGSTSSGTLNFTDFGFTTARTFVIQNKGTGVLNFENPYFSGADAPQFSLSILPSSSTLSSLATTSFEIIFTPTSTGVSSTTVFLNSNDCTYGTFSFVITATAVAGAALSLDGIDDYVDLGNSNLLKPTSALTAETWAYMSTWSGLCTMIGNAQFSGYAIRNNGTDLRGLVYVNGSFLIVSAPLSAISAGWHHIALTYDGRYENLYLDGVLTSTNDAGAVYAITNGTNNVILGADASAGVYPTGAFFSGKLDEVRIWDRALCQAEIQNNMHCEISSTVTGLLANYHFNEGVASGLNSSVSTLPDFSGNLLDGSLMDMQKQGAISNWVSPGAVTSGSSCAVFTSSEIDIIGNGVSIVDGATAATTLNSTDFSTVCVNSTVVRTFTIQNYGTAILTIANLSLTGSGAASFSFSVLLPASPVPTNSLCVFTVSFTPQTAGSHSAVLTINNNDCDEGTYDFVITGTANAIPTVTASITNSAVCAGSAVTLNGSGADTYTWSPTVSNGVSFIPAANQIYTLSGTYTLTGCTNTNVATQSLIVNAIPTVAITAPTITICSGTTATLTASGAATGGTYTWTPGASNATVLIVSPGVNTTYSVAGTTSAGCTSTNSSNQLITVNTTPTLTATSVNTAICNNFSATISVNGANTYSWMPGSLSGGTITVSPSSTTSYTALGYGAAGCVSSNSIVLTVTVNSLPVVTATASNPVICNTGTTSLIGGGATTYTWNPAATNGQAFTPPVGITDYTVTGTNALTGCTSTNLAVQSITVDSVPTVSVTTSNSVICNGASASLTASGAVNYTWNPGGFSGAAFNPTPSVFTTYTLTGTSLAGCTSTNLAVQSISVNSLPTVSASISNSVICSGQTLTVNGSGASTYTWTNGAVDGVAFSPVATGSYSLAGTNTAGCTSTNSAVVLVTVNALPTLSITVTNSVICLGDNSTLNANGALTYTLSNGITNGTAFSPTLTNQYTVTGTDANGCSDEEYSTITVNNLPVLTVVSSASLSCEALTVTLTANGAATYSWSTSETSASIIINPTLTTVYTIAAIDANACTNTVSFTQSVTPCPGAFSVTIDKTDISCSGKDNGKIVVTAVSSYSNPTYNYQWSPPSLCASNTCDTLKNLQSGTYYLTVKATYTVNGILVKTDSVVMSPIVLTDLNGPCDVRVFTGFSPNGDGINDVLTIENIEEFPNNNVTVYNRWGVEVFKIKGYNNLDKAFPINDEVKNLPSNTYFYIVDLGDGSTVIKGWIELIK